MKSKRMIGSLTREREEEKQNFSPCYFHYFLLRIMLLRLTILLLLLHLIQAQPTSCVTCINCQDLYDGTDLNSTCSSTVPNADSCQKTRIQLPGTTLIAKACARSCKEQSIIVGAIRLDVSCCTTSLCNTATTLLLSRARSILLISMIFLLINSTI